MKKIAITGIILVLVMMFVVTCEEAPAETEVEYTDVVYAEDGSTVTLYLNGAGVPVTPAQRAVNKELAMMAFDYFEVVFANGAITGGVTAPVTTAGDNVARAKWELGERAGIYGVPITGTGVDYGFSSSKACMFVGKKSDKTLLGVGYLINVDNATTATTTVTGSSKSVTFAISAIKTALILPTETSGYQDVPLTDNSFAFTTQTSATYVRETVNGSPLSYPKYTLPDATTPAATPIPATYTFRYVGPAGTNVFSLVKVINDTSDAPAIIKRVPRFSKGGRYMEPKDGWTSSVKINFSTATNTALGNNNSFPSTGAIGLTFATTAGAVGVFSFYLDIPVYNLTRTIGQYDLTAANAVPAEKWHVRTGVGSELYSLDDGVANGGCVFMQVGNSSSAGWIDIDWTWLNS